jgi:hypothetical protein
MLHESTSCKRKVRSRRTSSSVMGEIYKAENRCNASREEHADVLMPQHGSVQNNYNFRQRAFRNKRIKKFVVEKKSFIFV